MRQREAKRGEPKVPGGLGIGGRSAHNSKKRVERRVYVGEISDERIDSQEKKGLRRLKGGGAHRKIATGRARGC